MQTPSLKSKSDFFVIACEPSGDLLGFLLLQQLLSIDPSLKIAGVCGQEMRKLNIENILNAEFLSVMGFIDVARSFLKLSYLFLQVKREILKKKHSAVLLIDAPSFNLKMAKTLRKAGYQGKIIQYVCPTVWAWKKHRIQAMISTLDLLIPLFPFEMDIFKDTSLKTLYFGHPLVEIMRPFQREDTPHFITLFPGSRTSVIEKNLPLQLKVAKKLSKDFGLPLQVIAAHEKAAHLIHRHMDDPSIKIIPSEERYQAMQRTKLALATSGTVTLELSLCKVPTLVNYAIRPLDEWLATKIFKIKLPFYCIVNLLLNRELFPEYFGSRLILSKYEEKAQEILLQKPPIETIEKGCKAIQKLLLPISSQTLPEVLLSLIAR